MHIGKFEHSLVPCSSLIRVRLFRMIYCNHLKIKKKCNQKSKPHSSLLFTLLSIYLSMHTATPSFLSITRRAALRWRKARTYLGIPGYACETTGSARRQPDHIHMGRLTHLQTENISMLARREPVPHWYAAQSQKTDALPLSHGGSTYIFLYSIHFLKRLNFAVLLYYV